LEMRCLPTRLRGIITKMPNIDLISYFVMTHKQKMWSRCYCVYAECVNEFRLMKCCPIMHLEYTFREKSLTLKSSSSSSFYGPVGIRSGCTAALGLLRSWLLFTFFPSHHSRKCTEHSTLRN
jgi:hypothetical protein